LIFDMQDNSPQQQGSNMPGNGLQPQGAGMQGTNPQPQSTTMPDVNAQPVAFGMDLSGFKKEEKSDQPASVSISPETGPVAVDAKPEATTEKPVEYGSEALETLEKEHKVESAERKENTAPEGVTGQTQPVGKKITTDDKEKEKKPDGTVKTEKEVPVLKYDGFRIDPEIVDPEKIKKEKGKGDSGSALTAIYLFLDKLLRKQSEAK
jgi:hypothetical protein